jgi:HemY protein
MWRVLIYLAVLAVLAFAAVWLAEQPGSVALVWDGTSYSVGLAVAAIAGLFLLGVLLILWSLGRSILHLPSNVTKSSQNRRQTKGIRALSRGMIAVGAGDAHAARRHAGEAQRYLHKGEPLVMLLNAQAAQISGDRDGAEASFRAMAEDPETRVLGLRGLYVEARRRGEADTAWTYATEAARIAPAVTWANEAVLEAQCAKGDWRAALDTVERRSALGLLDRATAKRHRAVLLTADALTRDERDEEGALRAAKEAVKLAPDLVPAAALAGRILSRKMELRKAAKILEAAWAANPHPDLATIYTHLRIGDSAQDRMRRAETLTKLSTWDPESRLTLARAALEARDFEKARHTISPLVGERPSVRVCLLMAEIERAEHGDSGRAREWLSRAINAPRDKAWIADGIVSERWSPISPVTGRLDAFEWRTPPELIAGIGSPVVDEIVGDVDDRPDEPIAIEPPSAARRPAAEPAPAPARWPTADDAQPAHIDASAARPVNTAPAPAMEAAQAVTPASPGAIVIGAPVAPSAGATPVEKPSDAKVAPSAETAKPVDTVPASAAPAKAAPDKAAPAKITEAKPALASAGASHAAAVPTAAAGEAITPKDPKASLHPVVARLPDDPGADTDGAKPASRFRLFG